MINKYVLIIISTSVLLFSCTHKNATKNTTQQFDPTTYVNNFIGTGGHGHTYPGATVPFGMMQPSPDNGVGGWDWCSGYHYSDSTVVGFSNLHLSGTGIGDLVDLLFMPVNRKIDLTKQAQDRDDIAYKSSYSHDEEQASPGYYKVFLQDSKINVELTASKRTAFHKYTFDEVNNPSVVLDLGFAINWDSPTATAITIEDRKTISGIRHSTGWAKNQKLFYVARFSKEIIDHTLVADGKVVNDTTVNGTHTSGQFYFDLKNENSVAVQIAFSSVSIANAKQNLEGTIDLQFKEVHLAAQEKWRQSLSRIQIETPVDSLKELFYSALYHTQISPVTFSDKNGEFRLENDSIASAKAYTAYSTLSLWDTFRAQNPLLTLIEPDRVDDIVQSMLAYYEVNHRLPVWTLYGNETNTMTGYHSIPVIAEAYFKGIRDFDVEKAYRAMRHTMMQDDRGLNFYKEYGYIPYDKLDESVTSTLEYAYNDWCVAQMAKALGYEEDYTYFSDRARAYEKLFDKESGFMRGKSSDKKSFNEPFDPKFSRHRKNTDYTEGNAWQHSWFVLHEPEKLINLHGGKGEFTSMLEQLFNESSEITGDHISNDITGLIGQYAHGNEPSHHIAYLFNKAGQPWRTQYWVNQILNTQYDTTPSGLSGNEDAGQMSAWYVLSSMGLYPLNPASATYELTSPLFEKSIIKLGDDKTFTIIAKGVSEKAIYIQSATLNGEVFNKTTITHKTLLEGGELKFIMGEKPNKKWATQQ